MLQNVLNRSGRAVAGLYAHGLLRLDVRRPAPLPAGAKIIAANHPSTADPFLLMGMIPEPMSILITESCFKVAGLGQFLRGAGHVPVIQGQGRAAFEAGRQLLASGRTVGIFPEGALSPLAGGLCPLHTGVARLALISGAPVIPVGIHLQHEHIWFKEVVIDGVVERARWPLHGCYAVTVGDPLYLHGDVEDRACVHAALASISRRIAQLAWDSAQRVAEVRPAPRPAARTTAVRA